MPRPSATDKMPEFSGWVVNGGKYQLLDKLGSGAYGKVYRAMDTSSPPTDPHYYAIKCLLKHPTGSSKDRHQKREIDIHRKVSGHPNIVTFHESFHDDHYTYVVMGLYTGGDLFGAITEKRLYDGRPDRIKTTFIQILDAVQHCHSLGVYHRDVKPENSRDYGCGSTFYMSPECIGPAGNTGSDDVGYSHRNNDIWALGVILTNLVTGRNPWRIARPGDPCYDAFQENRDFLEKVLPISHDVGALLKDIFVCPAAARLSILELRLRMIDLDTLYSEQKQASVRSDVDKPEIDQPGASGDTASTGETLFASLETHFELGDNVEDAGFALARSLTRNDFDEAGWALAAPGPPARSPTPAHGSDKSDGSGTDVSAGPITPASNAMELKVDIPDVSEEMGGAKSMVARVTAGAPDKASDVLKAPQIIKTVYQRLKAL
ncbi:serine/threonine protein kinase, negative regulator of sexual conjugation and meiosis [Ephemerocybe angulata]|uniref:non-specific serine/threonine protein kinase n=1 Tax=Ephemerocybe angulata TaxID=980116 RepID=A0A8H6IDN6_9AGAR|nr:serine/threonine protein kinase, negative regulator of sexual conjugation and meiosis [Tulosesus angulatus]